MQIKRTLAFIDDIAIEAGRAVDAAAAQGCGGRRHRQSVCRKIRARPEPADQGERRDRPADEQDGDGAARAAQAGKLRQGRDHRHERRAGARRRHAHHGVRQRHARGGGRRQGVDFVDDQARGAGRLNRHSLRPQGRALRPLALRRHHHHAGRRAVAQRDRRDLRLRQPRPPPPSRRRAEGERDQGRRWLD